MAKEVTRNGVSPGFLELRKLNPDSFTQHEECRCYRFGLFSPPLETRNFPGIEASYHCSGYPENAAALGHPNDDGLQGCDDVKDDRAMAHHSNYCSGMVEESWRRMVPSELLDQPWLAVVRPLESTNAAVGRVLPPAE